MLQWSKQALQAEEALSKLKEAKLVFVSKYKGLSEPLTLVYFKGPEIYFTKFW